MPTPKEQTAAHLAAADAVLYEADQPAVNTAKTFGLIIIANQQIMSAIEALQVQIDQLTAHVARISPE